MGVAVEGSEAALVADERRFQLWHLVVSVLATALVAGGSVALAFREDTFQLRTDFTTAIEANRLTSAANQASISRLEGAINALTPTVQNLRVDLGEVKAELRLTREALTSAITTRAAER
jgi:hypothetical protein